MFLSYHEEICVLIEIQCQRALPVGLGFARFGPLRWKVAQHLPYGLQSPFEESTQFGGDVLMIEILLESLYEPGQTLVERGKVR